MLFIHGIGGVGEVTEILALPEIMESNKDEWEQMHLKFTLEFYPVTMYRLFNKRYA